VLPLVGQVDTLPYPFVRCKWSEVDDDGMIERDGWKPGVEADQSAENTDYVADGMGRMTLTVVSVHKPGKFPVRVFFTRRFTDPEGREFGKGKCHIATAEKYRRLARCYQHDFELRKSSVLTAASVRLSRDEGGAE
jgi:hypothetical protein